MHQFDNTHATLSGIIRRVLELSTPIDVEDMITKMGGQIVVAQDKTNVRRSIIEVDGESFKIYLHPDMKEEQKRVLVAKEVGYLFLHMGYLIDELKWNSAKELTDSMPYKNGYGQNEIEAMLFSHTLLMPFLEMQIEVANHTKDKMVSMEPIASHFGVTVDAARARCRHLHLVDWEI